jgi:hypothetical protein
MGRKWGAGPLRRRKSSSFYFSILFQDFQKVAALNQFLSNKMAFYGNGPKMKVA